LSRTRGGPNALMPESGKFGENGVWTEPATEEFRTERGRGKTVLKEGKVPANPKMIEESGTLGTLTSGRSAHRKNAQKLHWHLMTPVFRSSRRTWKRKGRYLKKNKWVKESISVRGRGRGEGHEQRPTRSRGRVDQ